MAILSLSPPINIFCCSMSTKTFLISYKMDDVACKTVVNESGVDAEGWRAGFNRDAREKIVNRILETFKNQALPCSDVNDLKNAAVKFEEKIYCDAASRDDYTYRICQKLLRMENQKYQNVSTSSSAPGMSQTVKLENVGHSSTLQNISGFSNDLVRNSVGQHVRSNTLSNAQRDIQGNQPSQPMAFQQHQRQQLQHQYLKQKVQKANIHPSFMQPNIHYSHDQQHQQILSQSSHLQSSQQLMLPTQQPRQLIGQQLLQQNHQFGQQNNLSEHQMQQPSFYLQNISNSFQQQLNPQCNMSGVQQPQNIVGSQSDVLNMQMHQHQHSANILQQAEANTAQKNVPWTSQPLQLHTLLGSQQKNNSLLESTPHRPQTSAALLQPQTVIDKQKLFKSQRMLPEASSAPVESAAHIENPNAADWCDQAYQKHLSLKEKVLPELCKAYKSAHSACFKAIEPGAVEKLKNKRSTLEKLIRFLQLSESEIVRYPKDKVVYYHQMIVNYWNSICKSISSAQNQGPQLQVPGSHSLTQLQQQRNMKPSLSPMSLISNTPTGTIPILSTHQGVPNSQPSTASSLQSSSQVGLEQRNASNQFHQNFMKPMQQNVLNVLQGTNSSNMALDHTMSCVQPNSAGATFPQLKQQQKHQLMQTQKLKPQMHQQWIHHRKQQMMQKMYEVDGNGKPLITVSSGMIQQHHSPGQNLDYSHQTLLSTNPHPLHATSPQTSQHSCPQIDQQNFLSPLSKSGTPLQSDASPFVVPSPSTPLTPSSVPVDPDKHSSGVFSLSVAENSGLPQTPVAFQVPNQNQAITMGTHGISASPLIAELTSPDGNEQSHIMRQPLDRLLKVVKSISYKALSASVHEIGSVCSMIDRIARTAGCNESGAAISLDLVANNRYQSQLRSTSGSPPSEKMNRHLTALTCDHISEIESTKNSRIKRCRIEPCNALSEEIRDINQRQVEIVLDIVSDSAKDIGTTGAGEGTIVRCSYNPVALHKNFKLCAASLLSILPLWFLVPVDYPNSSPTVLDKLPCDWSNNKKEHQHLSQKARSRFNLSLRNLSQPMSLSEMAKTWELCAHAEFSECAQLMGGECFTSRYGSWENCVVAS